MEQQNVFNQIGLGTYGKATPYTYPSIKTYVCPADPTNSTSAVPGLTSYVYNALVFAGSKITSLGIPTSTSPHATSMYETGGQRYPATITDGTSNTIFWTEDLAKCPGDYGGKYWAWANGSISPSAYNCICSSYQEDAIFSPPNACFYTGQSANTCFASGSTNRGGMKGTEVSMAMSAHTGVMLAGLGDGSVRNLAQGMSLYSYNLALIPNDGLPMPSDW